MWTKQDVKIFVACSCVQFKTGERILGVEEYSNIGIEKTRKYYCEVAEDVMKQEYNLWPNSYHSFKKKRITSFFLIGLNLWSDFTAVK